MDHLEGLRTFTAIVEAGSITAAAERLGISKKLASKYLGELENRLGARLLHRTTRSLSLSNAGERLYSRGVNLLEEYDAIVADIRHQDTGLAGVLRVSAPVSFGELFVQGALADFRLQHPDLTIDLRLDDRYVDIAADGFDIAIRIGDLKDSSLIAKPLGEIKLMAVASPDYIVRNGVPEHPHDLVQHRCIRDSNYRAGQSWPFEINGQTQRVTVKGGFVVNSATAVSALAVRGEGIGLCPDYSVVNELASGRLERVLSTFPSGQFRVQAVFGDARRMPARTRAVLDHLGHVFQDSPWQFARQAPS